MIDTTTGVVATGVVVTVGKWASDQNLTIKMFVGMAGVAIFLAILSSANAKFASQLTLLLLISAILVYGVPIGKKFGALK